MQFINLKAQYKAIAPEIHARIANVLEHGRYVMGPEIIELEKKLAEFSHVKYAFCVASGTDALLIALMALHVGFGDEVITTPFSFFASSETIALLGATPIFVDIDPRTYNIDPHSIEEKITCRTKAILAVNLYGQCADMDAINAIAARHHLPVIEDAAQSFGAAYKTNKSCGLTAVGCTSFFPSKPLGCYGDGGACFTNDDELAASIECLRNHGQTGRYRHACIGINSRMDSLQAAVLLTKLAVFPDELNKRQHVAERYTTLLSDYLQTPHIERDNCSSFAQYTIEVDHRESIIHSLEKQGIPTAVHYPVPLHLQPAFGYLNQGEGSFPYAERAAKRVLSLPMDAYITADEQQQIATAITTTLPRYANA